MTPKTEEELASIIKEANGSLLIEGGGTRGIVQNRVAAEGTISTAKLSGITLYEPGALTIVCLLYTSPSPRDLSTSRMPSSA